MSGNNEIEPVDWSHQDVDIERDGYKIILPAKPGEMPIPDAISALQRKQHDEEQYITFINYIDAFPLDGAVSFIKVLQEMFGWASPRPTPGFFGSSPPKMVGIQVSVDETAQVPFGRFEVPGVDGYLATHIGNDQQGNACFIIEAEVAKKNQHIVETIARNTQRYVKNHSIYKGKALRFALDKKGKISYDIPPTFVDTRDVDPEAIIMNDDVAEMVQTSIYNPIRYTDRCKQYGIPLNRGVLLEGTYGTGKTMVAQATAKVCEDNGWTFILLDRAQGLKDGLLFAQRYAPAVVFCEDIDRVTDERDEDANDLLNTIDGILTKNSQVIAVMTTNHVEKINSAMLRPGRLDAVISVAAPDAGSVQKLIRMYARDLLPESEPLEKVGEALAGNIPATIREVVERAKLRLMAHTDEVPHLVQADLLHAAEEMKVHLDLLDRSIHGTPPTPTERLAQSIRDVFLTDVTAEGIEKVKAQVFDIADEMGIA